MGLISELINKLIYLFEKPTLLLVVTVQTESIFRGASSLG
jgi:hypothetical protein